MMKNSEVNSDIRNSILKALPKTDYDLILSKSEVVVLQQGEILHDLRQEIQYVYFPSTALLSWIVITESGDMLEIGISDGEAMAGISIFLYSYREPYRVQVQMTGSAIRIKTDMFLKLCDELPRLQKRIRQFLQVLISQIVQSSLCARFHTVEQRLSRWLLAAQDRAQSNQLPLTQETLAAMIGARRPAVSLVVSRLQVRGLVRANRGKITIADREGLEAASCECYKVVREDLTRFMNSKV